jgi:hypothetical protein
MMTLLEAEIFNLLHPVSVLLLYVGRTSIPVSTCHLAGYHHHSRAPRGNKLLATQLLVVAALGVYRETRISHVALNFC